MPPKKTSAPQGPSKKTELKKKEKTIEDKTFGLKNKKGGKAQKFIAQVLTRTIILITQQEYQRRKRKVMLLTELSTWPKTRNF